MRLIDMLNNVPFVPPAGKVRRHKFDDDSHDTRKHRPDQRAVSIAKTLEAVRDGKETVIEIADHSEISVVTTRTVLDILIHRGAVMKERKGTAFHYKPNPEYLP